MKASHYVLIGSAAVLVTLIFTAPYIKEHKKYKSTMKGNSVELCNDYLREYSDHKHADAVKELKESLAFQRVQDERNEHTCDWYFDECRNGLHEEDVRYLKIRYSGNTLPSVNDYLNKYPNGKYAATVNTICDSLWDVEIEKYANRDKKKESPKAVRYMQEMLDYMKEHRVYSVFVDINSVLQLKDFEEYSAEKRRLAKFKYEDKSLPIEGNVVSLKSNFSQGNLSVLHNILVEGVQKSFDNMFTKGFIKAVSNSDNEDKCPKLHFDYTIKSQERDGCPKLWTYGTSRFVLDFTAKAYLIGINIKFNACFTIPGSDTKFEYSQNGEPENDIKNITDIRDGYRKMTEMCFAKFSNKMSKNLGLKETYFQ